MKKENYTQKDLFSEKQDKPATSGICSCSHEKLAIKNLFSIQFLSYNIAMQVIVREHYLHRTAPCSKAFALVCNKCKRIVGVIVYGVSSSSTLLRGICGNEEASNVYELTRLWIKDGTPKNSESYFIANTLKLLDKEIIVSFAEDAQGHKGVVYQASNFIYCGLSQKFIDPKVKGLEHQHHATYANGLTMDEVKQKYGEENVYFVERPRKHRYVYFNCNKRRKRELLAKLKYPVLPYPKAQEANQ
jgi:hypothetical protein